MPRSGNSGDALELGHPQQEGNSKDAEATPAHPAANGSRGALLPDSRCGHRRSISASVRHWIRRSPPKEFLLGMALITTTFLGGGLIFGFTPLANRLVKLDGPFTDANKGSVFAVGHNITVVGLILSGFLLDRWGPRFCAVSGLLIEAVGHFGLMHAASYPQWMTWTAYGFVGLGGTQVLMAALTFADGFRYSGMVNSSLTACYQAGGFVFMVLPHVDWVHFFRLYTFLCVFTAVACFLLYPDKPLQSGSQEEVEQSEPTEHRSLRSVLIRPGTVMFLLTFMIAGSALIYGQGEFATGTKVKAGCKWVEHLFVECKQEKLYTSLNDIWFPLVGNFILPCSLVIGWLIDKHGFAIPAFINVFAVQAFILAFWVLDLEWQFVTLILYNIANTAIFTTQNAYVCFVAHEHIGALYAISNAVMGVGNLLSDYLTANPFGSGKWRVDTSIELSSIFWLILCTPLYAWVAAEVFHRRKQDRQAQSSSSSSTFIATVTASVLSGAVEPEQPIGMEVAADADQSKATGSDATAQQQSSSSSSSARTATTPGIGDDSLERGTPLLAAAAVHPMPQKS